MHCLAFQFQINSVSTQHSDESSSHNLIPSIEVPINDFKNQIFIRKANSNDYKFSIPFPIFHRHDIYLQTYELDELILILRKYLNPSVINDIQTSEDIMGKIQSIYPDNFSKVKIRFTQSKVAELTNESEQEEEILKVHNRAHRNATENKIQLSEKFYFPK